MKIHHQIVLKYDSSKTIVELLAKIFVCRFLTIRQASRHRNRNIDCSPVRVVNTSQKIERKMQVSLKSTDSFQCKKSRHVTSSSCFFFPHHLFVSVYHEADLNIERQSLIGNGVVKWVINKKTTSYDKHNTMEYSTVEWATINKAEHNVEKLFQLCIVEAPPALPRKDRVVQSNNYQIKVLCSYSRQIACFMNRMLLSKGCLFFMTSILNVKNNATCGRLCFETHRASLTTLAITNNFNCELRMNANLEIASEFKFSSNCNWELLTLKYK
ncbi:hypothetical protein T07_13571 [Trichinella nelsoni]|uniref:Uncharacterized protein n=1 Tax=Trichinella nelsoni TaxID=6336 RepID=A0A0V0SMT5_9BILA|nr:hypothetical protein T07_13571 [Trichinella nelsoni]